MIEKKCPVYKKCNGCQLMNMSYEEQLRFKEIKCVRSLGKYGRVEKITPMENPYFYRNKIQSAFGIKNGRIFYIKNGKKWGQDRLIHRFVANYLCFIIEERGNIG